MFKNGIFGNPFFQPLSGLIFFTNFNEIVAKIMRKHEIKLKTYFYRSKTMTKGPSYAWLQSMCHFLVPVLKVYQVLFMQI